MPKTSRERPAASDWQMRDQEVLRANRELAAYFRGRRTEREARAALKIIKAFIRDRERLDAGKRRPLPGAAAPPAPTPSQKKGKRKTRSRSRPEPAGAAPPVDQPPSDG